MENAKKIQPVFYVVNKSLLNLSYCNKIKAEILKLSEKQQTKFIKEYTQMLIQIDNNEFDTQLNVSHPIRFYFNEYRHVIYQLNNGKN